MFEIVELLGQVNVQMFKLLSPIVKPNNISISELIILWKINKRGPYRVTDIAREAGLPPSTLTGIFDRLESQHYLERVHDSKDRRSVLIQGTPQLQELIDTVIQKTETELKSLFNSMPADYFDRLTGDLQQLKTQLSQNLLSKGTDE